MNGHIICGWRYVNFVEQGAHDAGVRLTVCILNQTSHVNRKRAVCSKIINDKENLKTHVTSAKTWQFFFFNVCNQIISMRANTVKQGATSR